MDLSRSLSIRGVLLAKSPLGRNCEIVSMLITLPRCYYLIEPEKPGKTGFKSLKLALIGE
jgi:hypothetical protein